MYFVGFFFKYVSFVQFPESCVCVFVFVFVYSTILITEKKPLIPKQ